MKILENLLPEMDKAVALAARQLMQTAAYGNLLAASKAEHRAFVATGKPGQMVEIRSVIMQLNASSVEIKVTVQQENRPGRIKKLLETHFTFALIRSLSIGIPAPALPEALLSISSN